MLTPETQDTELLRRYADEGSEEAFGEVVRRHLGLVYSAAQRQLNDPDRAQDVAQAVFVELARQANRLSRHPALVGWLHTTTFHLARRVLRDEFRRRRREQEALSMHDPESAPEPDWQHLKPALDEALQELRETDRAAVLLRHLEGRTLREVGASLGLTEDAARMRVQRALERLQAVLVRKGVVASGATVSAHLLAHGVETVPAGLAGQVAVAVSSATTSTAAATTAGTGFWISMKAPVLLTTAAVALVAVPLTVQHQRLRELEARLTALPPATEVATAALGPDPDAGLRQEVAQLRSLLPDLERLRAEAQGLRQVVQQPVRPEVQAARVEVRDAEAEAAAAEAEQVLRQVRQESIEGLKHLGIAARVFATDHADRLPETFEEMKEEMGPDDSPAVRFLDRFEFCPQPRKVSEFEPELFLFREKAPRQRPDGTWERAYGRTDGSVQLLTSPTADFADEERAKNGIATGEEPPR